jgi:hypothetical protein
MYRLDTQVKPAAPVTSTQRRACLIENIAEFRRKLVPVHFRQA